MRILLFSDIHNDFKRLARLVETEADYYFCCGDLVSWARGLEKAGEVVRHLGNRLLIIPGNHESDTDIDRFCDAFGFRNVHGQVLELGGHTIAALGYSNITPFDTPGEFSEEEMAERLNAFRAAQPRVVVCHCPPRDTRLDQAKPGLHFGSEAVRTFLEEQQPEYFFCGHIHEAEGQTERMGRTLGVNVGKQGYLLELE